MRSLAIASDHTGVSLRRTLVVWLRGRGLSVHDLGTDGPDAVDYPDVAASVARAVARGEVHAGIVIDGAGIGSAIAANKVHGVRAAMATRIRSPDTRASNGANVLTLGATLVTVDEAQSIVGTWLSTPMREARYVRRLAKIETWNAPRMTTEELRSSSTSSCRRWRPPTRGRRRIAAVTRSSTTAARIGCVAFLTPAPRESACTRLAGRRRRSRR